MSAPAPKDVLPHGPGMQLLDGAGEFRDGWLTFRVSITPDSSTLDRERCAPAELGLEMMAQASGMLLAQATMESGVGRRIGVVGAVRGYSYETTPFRIGEEVEVRVRADLLEGDVVVCEGVLYRAEGSSPAQKARITLIVSEEEVA